MSRYRDRAQILQWLEQGRLRPEDLPVALKLTGAATSREDWWRLLDRLSLWLGALFIAAGVVFFFAYNWTAMDRFAKFGLIELLLVVAVAFVWRLGLDWPEGKAALLVATLLAGGLLALVGQTYQTGADPWELFAVWAVLIFPWVLAGCFGALWLLWIGLINLAVILYFKTFGGLFGTVISSETLMWILFFLNSAALVAWEWGTAHFAWLQERWPPRVLAAVGGGLITCLALWAVIDFRGAGFAPFLGYIGWIAAAHSRYRYYLPDLFILAAAVLSIIVLATAALSRMLLSSGAEAIVFLLIGLTVIGLSAVGGLWLKKVASEGGEHGE